MQRSGTIINFDNGTIEEDSLISITEPREDSNIVPLISAEDKRVLDLLACIFVNSIIATK